MENCRTKLICVRLQISELDRAWGDLEADPQHLLRSKELAERAGFPENRYRWCVAAFAVQIAKSYGTEVTGVCSTRNLDMVLSIGADHVVDYTKKDFTKNGQHYDLIFDAVGNRSVSDHRRALNPEGICVIAGFTTLSRSFGHMFLGPLMSITGSRKIGMMETVRPGKQDLLVVKELLEAGHVVPVLDRCYPLSETAEAIRYLEKGHARGKVIVTVTPSHNIPRTFCGCSRPCCSSWAM